MEVIDAKSLDPWFVTGFVDGEGAFTYSHSDHSLALYFAIKVTAADRSLLEQIREFFGGIGKIYAVRPRAALTLNSGNTKAAVYYRVCRKQELLFVVNHFDRYQLQGVKAASFRVWREMVLLQNASRTSRAAREALTRKLSSLSPRNQPLEPAAFALRSRSCFPVRR